MGTEEDDAGDVWLFADGDLASQLSANGFYGVEEVGHGTYVVV